MKHTPVTFIFLVICAGVLAAPRDEKSFEIRNMDDVKSIADAGSKLHK